MSSPKTCATLPTKPTIEEGRKAVDAIEAMIAIATHRHGKSASDVVPELAKVCSWLRIEFDFPNPWSSLEDLWERADRRAFVAENKQGLIFSVAAKTPSGNFNFIGWNASGMQHVADGAEIAWKLHR